MRWRVRKRGRVHEYLLQELCNDLPTIRVLALALFLVHGSTAGISSVALCACIIGALASHTEIYELIPSLILRTLCFSGVFERELLVHSCISRPRTEKHTQLQAIVLVSGLAENARSVRGAYGRCSACTGL